MHGFGYKDERFSPGLYVAEDGQSMIGTYVDDCIIAASNPGLLEHITSLIASKISVKTVATMQDDIFEADVPGIDLHYDKKRGMVSLSLETYITNMINAYYRGLRDRNRRELELPHSTVYNTASSFFRSLTLSVVLGCGVHCSSHVRIFECTCVYMHIYMYICMGEPALFETVHRIPRENISQQMAD